MAVGARWASSGLSASKALLHGRFRHCSLMVEEKLLAVQDTSLAVCFRLLIGVVAVTILTRPPADSSTTGWRGCRRRCKMSADSPQQPSYVDIDRGAFACIDGRWGSSQTLPCGTAPAQSVGIAGAADHLFAVHGIDDVFC